MVVNIEDLKKYTQGEEVLIPGFDSGEPIAVLLRRPSLLRLAGTGEIPNTLLTAAGSLFDTGVAKIGTDASKQLPDMYNVLLCITKASLLSPTLAEIEQAGLTLTDQQMVNIFYYAQGGVKLIEPFREKQEDSANHSNGEPVQQKAKRNART